MSDFLEFGEYTDPKQLALTLAEGEATFKITAVVPKQSKSGHKMFVVTMSVRDVNGMSLNIDDYLIVDTSEAGMKRLKTKIMNISKSIGKPELYSPGKTGIKPNDILGYGGKCLVKTQSSVDYPDKSVIAKYLPDEKIAEKERQDLIDKQTAQLDDDIPF